MADTINNRIKLLIERFADGNNSKFADLIGTSEANVRNYRTKTEPKIETINQICSVFEINYEWLLAGTGNILKSENKAEKAIIDYGINIPIVDVSVAAGMGAINPDNFEVDNTITLPERLIRGCNSYLCVKVRGESMAPTLRDSSYMVIGEIDKSQWANIPDKHVYVIVDKEGRSFIKRVKNRLKQGFIVCMSDNIDKVNYPNFNLDFDDIHSIWHAEWYFTAKMENINENYYSRLEQIEAEVEGIKILLGEQTLLEYKNRDKTQ